MSVSSLLTVLGFLTCRAAAMGTGNVLLFLGLSLHLAVVSLLRTTATAKVNAILENLLKVYVLITHRVYWVYMAGL